MESTNQPDHCPLCGGKPVDLPARDYACEWCGLLVDLFADVGELVAIRDAAVVYRDDSRSCGAGSTTAHRARKLLFQAIARQEAENVRPRTRAEESAD